MLKKQRHNVGLETRRNTSIGSMNAKTSSALFPRLEA